MDEPKLFRPHGGVRGRDLSRASLLFGGPFGRMFRALPPADFGNDDAASLRALKTLATAIVAGVEPPSDGPDPEESGIPAAYTYFGQFIDHDLTFDPASSLQKQNDPDALVDYRTPRFDLDNVYGRGPDDQPYLYSDGKSFNLGRDLTGAAGNPRAKDLARSSPAAVTGSDGVHHHPPKRAIIGDPRNDENVIVSQLQGLFLRLHNRFARTRSFTEAQRLVRWHYQWVVLNDFLPRIVNGKTLMEVLPHLAVAADASVAVGEIAVKAPHLKFFKPKNEAFMPLEFSAAAYRFGHSMVRPEYQLNATLPEPNAIFHGGRRSHTLRGFGEFPDTWAIEWGFFIDLAPLPFDGNVLGKTDHVSRTQFAYRIDTSIVGPLGTLPKDVGFDPSSLALRNLERGWRMRLPTGQDVARAMGVVPLPDDQIFIGKFTGPASAGPPQAQDDSRGTITTFPASFPATDKDGHPINAEERAFDASVFAGNCPLWTYVLAETIPVEMKIITADGPAAVTTYQLGPVGGRIVAETIAGLLLVDSSSVVSQYPRWKPNPGLTSDGSATGSFGLRELIAAALGDDADIAADPLE